MAAATAIQWKGEQVTKGRSDSNPMEGGAGDQWQQELVTKGRSDSSSHPMKGGQVTNARRSR
jgi:hypothetical protein